MLEKILHMGARRRWASGPAFRAVGPIHSLRQVADLLAPRDGAIRAEHVFGDAGMVVAEAGIPGEQQFVGCSMTTFIVSGTSRPSFQR